jgi:predicted nucleotidyltransferase
MGYEEIIAKTKKFSACVVDFMHPKMIVLYGSYAKGTAHENSDIDIAVIFDSIGNDFLEKSHQLFKLRRGIDSRIEPILIEQENDRSGFCEEILKTGKVIYSA